MIATHSAGMLKTRALSMTLKDRVLDVLRSEDRDWERAEIVHATGAEADSVSATLGYLKRKKAIQHVGRGLYRFATAPEPEPVPVRAPVSLPPATRPRTGKLNYRTTKNGVRTSLPPDYPIPTRIPATPAIPSISTISVVPKYEERGFSGWNTHEYRASAATKPFSHLKLVELFEELKKLRMACWLAIVGAQVAIVPILRQLESAETKVPKRLFERAHVTDSMAGRQEIAQWLLEHDTNTLKLRTIMTVIQGSRVDPQWLPPEVQGRDFVSWRRACAKALKQYDDLRGKIAAANVGLAMRAARKLGGRGGYLFEDLVNEGFVGLLSAVDRFNPDRKFRFSTYATHWVRHAMNRAIENNGRVVRLPVHLQVHNVHMLRVRDALGGDPKAIAAELGIGLRATERLLRQQGSFVTHASLAAPIFGDEGDAEMVDVLVDESADPIGDLERAEDRALLDEIMAELTDHDRMILQYRFGIDCEPRTLDMIGRELGVCRERVRQLQNIALGKLRRMVARHEIRAFLSSVDLPIVDEPAEKNDPTAPAAEHRQRVTNFFAERADPTKGWSVSEIARVLKLRGIQVRQICRSMLSEGLLRLKDRKYWGLLHREYLESLLMESLGATPTTPGELALRLGIRRAVLAKTLYQMAADGRICGTRRSYSLSAANAAASA